MENGKVVKYVEKITTIISEDPRGENERGEVTDLGDGKYERKRIRKLLNILPEGETRWMEYIIPFRAIDEKGEQFYKDQVGATVLFSVAQGRNGDYISRITFGEEEDPEGWGKQQYRHTGKTARKRESKHNNTSVNA